MKIYSGIFHRNNVFSGYRFVNAGTKVIELSDRFIELRGESTWMIKVIYKGYKLHDKCVFTRISKFISSKLDFLHIPFNSK